MDSSSIKESTFGNENYDVLGDHQHAGRLSRENHRLGLEKLVNEALETHPRFHSYTNARLVCRRRLEKTTASGGMPRLVPTRSEKAILSNIRLRTDSSGSLTCGLTLCS